MNKSKVNKASKVSGIRASAKLFNGLHSDLMSKFDEIDKGEQTDVTLNTNDHQFQLEAIEKNNDPVVNLLEKAKKITTQNKDTIQHFKRQFKKSERDSIGSFLTGVGIFVEETPIQKQSELPERDVNPNDMLKSLVESQYDDLAELRKMIKKTQKNLNSYSKGILDVQNQVLNAADRYHQQIDVGLTIKMNQCNAPGTFYKKNSSKDNTKSESRKSVQARPSSNSKFRKTFM